MSSGSAQQNQQPFDIYNQQPNTAGKSDPVKSTSPPSSRPTTQSPPRQSGPPTIGQSPSGRHNPPAPPPKQQPPTQAPPSQSSSGQQANNDSAASTSPQGPTHQQQQPAQQHHQPTLQQQSPQQQSSSDYSPWPPSATKTTNKAPPTPTEIPLSAWRRGSSSNLRNSGSFSSASGMPPMAPTGRYQGDNSTGSTPPAKAAAPPASRPPTTPPTTSSSPPSQTQLPPPSAPQQGSTQQTPQPAPQQGSPSPPPAQVQPPAQNSQPSSVTKPGQQPQVQPPQSTAAAQSTPTVQPQQQAAPQPVTQQAAPQPVAQQAAPQPVAQQAAPQPVAQQAAKPVTAPQSAPQQAVQPTAQPGQTAQHQPEPVPHPVAPQNNSAAPPSKSVPPPTRPTVATTTQPPAASPQPAATSSPHRSPSRDVHPTPNQTPVRHQPAENSYLQPSSPNGGKRASIPWVTPSDDASRNDADNECTYVTMGSMAHHVIERLDEDNHTSSTTQQHFALVETSKMVDDMLIHRPEDLSKSGRCLHLHNPHHVTRRGEIVFAPTTGNTLESNTTPHTLTSWPIPPPTPGNYGRLQSIQGQITLVGCHRYEPDVMEELAYVDRAISEGPNRRGYFSVERTNEALYGRTKNAYPDTGNLKYNASHFSPGRQQQMNHAPNLVGSAVERSSPFTPQRQMDSFLMSPNSERNPRPPVPQNTPAHAMYPSSSYDATSTPTRQPANTDGPQLVSSRTERLDRPSASPLLYRMESSPLHY